MSKRLYPHKRVRYWYAYDLDEICALFSDTGLHIQTVRKWITRDGLKTIDNGKPALIYGQHLIDFFKRQNAKGKCQTPFDQMYCLKCHDARPAYQSRISIDHKDNFLTVGAVCRECKSRMNKSYKIDNLGDLKRRFRVVDVLELYDDASPAVKTHIHAQEGAWANESRQGELAL